MAIMGIKSLIYQRIKERVKNWRKEIWLHLVIMFYHQVNPKNGFHFWIPCFTTKQTQSHTWKCVWIRSKESNKSTTKASRSWQLVGSASWHLWKDSHRKSHCRERNQILLRATSCWAQFPMHTHIHGMTYSVRRHGYPSSASTPHNHLLVSRMSTCPTLSGWHNEPELRQTPST